MINKTPSKTISAYKKRQQMGPFIIWGGVVLLIILGVILLVVWFASGNAPKFTLFATDTPTPTITASPTSTSTPTLTPTLTETPTVTFTPTPSAPFEYTVQEGDYLFLIVEKFQLGDNGVALLLLLNPYTPDNAERPGIDPESLALTVGQKIIVPNPGMELPTATPIPTGLAPGTKVQYTIQPGETLALIASKFNSTVEDIKKENGIENENTIQAFQIITVRVNLVTPTITSAPTVTSAPSITPTATPTP